jgi:hypothetical protein
MTLTPASRFARPRRWSAVLAWVLWALARLGLAAVSWFDHLSRQAGRPDLAQFGGTALAPVVGHLSATTVGAVLASRRPRHPVGWLLLAFALALMSSGLIASYTAYGLLARPGALPAAGGVALYYPATAPMALALLSLVLLFTPTGSLPSARWRWWAWVTMAVPVVLLLVVPLAPGQFDPQLLVGNSPFNGRALGGVLLAINQVALAVTTLAVVAAAGSLMVRFRRARGTERQQLRWVALAAALMALAALVILAAIALGTPVLVDWAAVVCVAVLPLAVGAAILRYRLYDLDRIISRTLSYGLLTVLLGLGYAGAVLLLEQLFGGVGERTPSWAVAGVTLAVAALFQPARRRIQQAVDRRFNRSKHNAANTIQAFSTRLREQIDLDALATELLAVVDQTMEPTRVSLWLRPSALSSSRTPHSETRPTTWAY